MAPKTTKKQEDVADKPPEGDDERTLTIQLSVELLPAYLSSLRSPMFSLTFGGEEQHKLELSPEAVLQSNLQLTLFSKKVVISPAYVDSVLSGRTTISLYSLPEVKEVAAAPTTKGGKAPAATKAAGKAPTSVLEMSLDELALQSTFSFDLCGLFSKKEMSRDIFTLARPSQLQGFVKGTVSCVCSDVLLAPVNVAKYLPVIIEVTSVTNLPSDGPIPLENNGFQRSVLDANGSGSVYVEYDFLGEVVRSNEMQRTANATFGFRKAFFLYKLSRLDLMQKLYTPVEFEVHDQEHVKSKLRPSFGVATVNLRTAITDRVRRFASATQLLPCRESAEGALPPADYVSFGTTLKTTVDFITSPLSSPVYVRENFVDPGDFLSRVLLIMPYQSPVVAPALQAIMGTLVTLKKGGSESVVREADIPQETKKSTGNANDKQAAITAQQQLQQQFRLHVPSSITGFEVMDDERRVLCFEGPLSIVHKLAEVATSVVGDDPECKILVNAELQFPQRLYHTWPPLVVPMEEKPPVKAPTPPPVQEKQDGKNTPAPKKAAKKKVEVEVVKSAAQSEIEQAPPEIDAGGVGGRIRRIRLGVILKKLMLTQRNFIKRTLPVDAIKCISKLFMLRETRSILEALDLNLFPSTSELISLERVHGQTLELMDVSGSNEFVSFSDADVTSIVNKAQEKLKMRPSKVREVDITALTLEDVGLVVSFDGIPANGQQKQGMSFGPSFGKMKRKAFIFSLEHQRAIACAFSADPPTQMLRHSFTAQIVNSDGMPVLFVIDCRSLAKNSSDHLNLPFDAKLRRDKKRAPAKEYFSQLAARKAHYQSTHTLSQSHQYKDESSDDEEGFVDGVPQTNHGLEQQELIPNYVVLNRKLPAVEVPHEDIPDYELARTLYEKQSLRLAATQGGHSSSSLGDSPRESFQTIIHRTAEETRRHPQVPSQQRIDDLHQKWEPPQGYRGTKTGVNPFRYEGARNVLQDKERSTSVFNDGLTAEERRRRDLEDRQRVLDDWKTRVVVTDTTFHVSGKHPSDHPACQADALRSLLDSPPQKLALQATSVPPAPPSIFTHEKMPSLTRVDASQSKHPDKRSFYYARGAGKLSLSGKPISDDERHSPLYY